MKKFIILLLFLTACEFESNIPCVEHNRNIQSQIREIKSSFEKLSKENIKKIDSLENELLICT